MTKVEQPLARRGTHAALYARKFLLIHRNLSRYGISSNCTSVYMDRKNTVRITTTVEQKMTLTPPKQLYLIDLAQQSYDVRTAVATSRQGTLCVNLTSHAAAAEASYVLLCYSSSLGFCSTYVKYTYLLYTACSDPEHLM